MARCQRPGCDAEVLNGHHCREGHVQVHGLDTKHPKFREAIPDNIRAKRCKECGGFIPCKDHPEES